MNHLEVWEQENYQSQSEIDWLRWIEHAEKLAGHSLDGDEVTGGDNYSLDSAYQAWSDGWTVTEYVNSIH